MVFTCFAVQRDKKVGNWFNFRLLKAGEQDEMLINVNVLEFYGEEFSQI